MDLSSSVDEIRALRPLDVKVYFRLEHWQNYKYNNRHLRKQICEITDAFCSGLSRRDIIKFVSQHREETTKAFLLALIWGHGYDLDRLQSGDNRGPWKVSKFMQESSSMNDHLKCARDYVLNGEMASAHGVFDAIKGIGVSYFSKYLYFIGRGLNVHQYPLIFDFRVANGIVKYLTQNHPLIDNVTITTNPGASAYQSYVLGVHDIATKYLLEAESIEYFLFLKGEN